MGTVRELERQFTAAMTTLTAKREAYHGAGVPMPAEDDAECGRLLDEADRLKGAIERERRADALTDWGGAIPNDGPGGAPVAVAAAAADLDLAAKQEQAEVFKAYLTGGEAGLRRFYAERPTVKAAMQIDNDPTGGYFAPPQFMADVIATIDNQMFVRMLATTYRVPTVQDLTFPVRETDFADAPWTGEIDEAAEAEGAFELRRFRPQRLARLFRLSNDLLTVPGFDVAAYWTERARVKLQYPQETAFMNGSGVNQPIGVFNAVHPDGIPTGRDTTTAANNAIAGDEWMDVEAALLPQYRMNAAWIMSPTVKKELRQAKGTDGHYLWAPSLTAAAPSTLLGYPIYESNFAPAFAAGAYAAILGDFSMYYIVDTGMVSVQRLDELYARTNQTGYIVRTDVDGAPVLPEAFARLKMAS